jgi:hypothetical protein
VPNAGTMLQLKAVAHAKMTSGTSDAGLNAEQQKIQDKITALKNAPAPPGISLSDLANWKTEVKIKPYGGVVGVRGQSW